MNETQKSSFLADVRTFFVTLPVDIILLGLYLVVSSPVLLLSTNTELLSRFIGLPLAVFVPGYTIISTLFPTSAKSQHRHRTSPGQISLSERFVFSLGASIAVLPPIGIVLSSLGVPLTRGPVVSSLLVVSVVGLLTSGIRRHQFPLAEQFTFPVYRLPKRIQSIVLGSNSRLLHAANTLLIIAVVLAVAALFIGVLVPNSASTYTELAIMTENETGSYVMGDYDRALFNESRSLYVSISNKEERPVNYTVVVVSHTVNESDEVVAGTGNEITRLHQTVQPGDRWYGEVDYTPETRDGNTRLMYLLYKESPPTEPTASSAYRYTYLWVNDSDRNGRISSTR